MEAIYKKIYKRVKPLLDTRANEPHARVSYRYGLKLLKAEGGDPEIVIPSILLHDIGWKMIPEKDHLKMFGPKADKRLLKIHEREGARMAARILRELGYPEGKAKAIISIVKKHDTSTRPRSLNEKIVKDSDRLWRFSKQGFLINGMRFKVLPQKHLSYLQKKIEEWFFTDTAKGMALKEIQKGKNDLKLLIKLPTHLKLRK
jgi:Fe-S cluster biosynthesis and repair protein YggX